MFQGFPPGASVHIQGTSSASLFNSLLSREPQEHHRRTEVTSGKISSSRYSGKSRSALTSSEMSAKKVPQLMFVAFAAIVAIRLKDYDHPNECLLLSVHGRCNPRCKYTRDYEVRNRCDGFWMLCLRVHRQHFQG